jgi:hypothetical protein
MDELLSRSPLQSRSGTRPSFRLAPRKSGDFRYWPNPIDAKKNPAELPASRSDSGAGTEKRPY